VLISPVNIGHPSLSLARERHAISLVTRAAQAVIYYNLLKWSKLQCPALLNNANGVLLVGNKSNNTNYAIY
jgi:hypothetical protein